MMGKLKNNLLLIVEYIDVLSNITFTGCEFMEKEAIEYCIKLLKRELSAN